MKRATELKRIRLAFRWFFKVGGQGWKRREVAAVVYSVWLGIMVLAMNAFHLHAAVDGTIITNKQAGIPERYGMHMRAQDQATSHGKEPYPAPAAGSFQAVALHEKRLLSMYRAEEPEGQLPLQKLLYFIAASIGGLYAVTKAASSLTSPLLGRIIYLAFFCGIFLFAYTSYAESPVTTCYSLKDKALDILETAAVR